jgi:phenylacetate-CoA ligase
MDDHRRFVHQVYQRVPAYRRFLDQHRLGPDTPWEELPLTDKKGYLLAHPLEDLCWDGSLAGCHLIGSSSGFSRTGSLFWPKRPQDEAAYLQAVEYMLKDYHHIHRRRTLVLVCLAFGTWIGGMQLAAALRTLAGSGRLPLTVCTPGLNLGEAVEIYARFHHHFQQSLWITNVSNVSLIATLMERRGLEPHPGSVFFGVVGEYLPEAFRAWVARRFGHPPQEPFCVWTGYGSADTGDLGVETRSTIALRRYLYERPELSRRLLGSENTPLIMAASPKAHLEVVGGNLVATKDQLVPLVRYDTGDAGAVLARSHLARVPELPPELLRDLPQTMVCVSGRASDAVVFYGTNLMVGDIHEHLLSLPPEMAYGGAFELAPRQEEGVSVFHFKVFVDRPRDQDLARRYQEAIVAFLESRSLEFRAKYRALCASVGRELIEVELADAARRPAHLKHRFLVQNREEAGA